MQRGRNGVLGELEVDECEPSFGPPACTPGNQRQAVLTDIDRDDRDREAEERRDRGKWGVLGERRVERCCPLGVVVTVHGHGLDQLVELSVVGHGTLSFPGIERIKPSWTA